MSRQNWQPWQMELVLPVANPRTPILNATAFGCFRCGTQIVAPNQIRRFGDPGSSGKTNAVWTKCKLDGTTKPNEEPVWNDSKQVYVNGISCRQCDNKIGSFYPKGYVDNANGVEGPCCKLTHFRLAKNGKMIRHMVALGTKNAVETALHNHSPHDTVSSSEEDEEDDEELQRLEQKLRDMEMETLRNKIQKKKQEKKALAEGKTDNRPRSSQAANTHSSSTPSNKPALKPFKGTCFKCYKKGHRDRDCQEKSAFRLNKNAPASDRAFDKFMKTEAPPLKLTQAVEFVHALCNHTDPTEVLWRMVNVSKEYGGKRLREALSIDLSPQHFTNTTIPLLQFLSSEYMERPMYVFDVDKIVKVMFETPGYLDRALIPFLSSHHHTDDDSNNNNNNNNNSNYNATTTSNNNNTNTTNNNTNTKDKYNSLICWFLIRLALTIADARVDPRLAQGAVLLESCGCQQSSKLFTILQLSPISSSTANNNRVVPQSKVVATSVQCVPGGRHDNDFADFRRIRLMPTVNELQCLEDDYLPLGDDSNRHTTDDHAHTLDTQFRLLRADVMFPLRKELKDFKDGNTQHSYNLHGAGFINAKISPRACVELKFRMSKKIEELSSARKERFWTERSVLSRGSVVCLTDQHGDPLLLGRVVDRDEKRLAKEQVIGLSFEGHDLISALSKVNQPEWKSMRVIEISASFASYEPMLRCLQRMVEVPFAEEILHCTSTQQIEYPTADARLCMDASFRAESIANKLDTSQHAAVRSALNNRMTLIQGPPGTGKTRVGVMIAKLLLNHNAGLKILCVCYKNHALDQFMERLEAEGVTNMVRIGSRCTNEAVQKYELRRLTEKTCHNAIERQQWYLIKQEVQALEMEFKKHVGFMTMNTIIWRRMHEHLVEIGNIDYLEQLTVPRDGEFTTIGADGKALRDNYLWEQWCKGLTPGLFEGAIDGSLWRMTKPTRDVLYAEWLWDMRQEQAQQMVTIMKRHHEVTTTRRDMQRAGELSVMQAAQIVGCTTHGAASFKDLLALAGAKVLIVEEAAEILESHTLTSMCKDTEHVIMIGDHKQLRPKIECYRLSVEGHEGHSFNVSLFERLVRNDFPYRQLNVQHRMRPELSRLIRHFTYPKLNDGDNVQHLPPLKGVVASSLPCPVFVHHDHPEEADQDVLSVGSKTKVNHQEASLVTSIVKYLLQQGYTPQQLVVLTPYLGQVRLLTTKLSTVCSVLLGDLDKDDMERAGVDPIDTNDDANPADLSVRVATIDNYQGEESDVVVASLVRSNQQGVIGHLQEPQRVNVLLSRARHGLILVGNALMLEKFHNKVGKMDWRALVGMFRERKSLYPGFPACCQQHKSDQRLFATPDDFARLAPEGGCLRPCGYVLRCGHECTRQCHSFDPHHSRVQCRRVVLDRCAKGDHKVTRECCKPLADVVCQACVAVRNKERERERLLECQRVKAEKEDAKRAVQKADFKTATKILLKDKEREKVRVLENKRANAKQDDVTRALKEADKEITRIATRPYDFLRKRELKNEGADHVEYNQVKDRAESSAVHLGITMKVTYIEKVTNPTLEKKWHRARKQLINPVAPPHKLFHGTSAEVTDMIVEGGFKAPEWKDTNMYGQGVYFATNSTKSANPIYTKESCRLILCDVLVGKPCTVPGLMSDTRFPLKKHVKKARTTGSMFLDVDLAKVVQAGFDSVYAPRGTRSTGGVEYDEMIVYDHRLALPRYIVHYGAHGRPTNFTTGSKVVLKSQNENVSNDLVLTRHYDRACTQFRDMMGTTQVTIVSVEYYGYETSALQLQYDKCKAQFRSAKKGDNDVWVFHGTPVQDNIPKIMLGGFKVGGQDSHPISNGAAHGQGVYSACGPDTPMQYGSRVKAVILAKGLPGKCGRQGEAGVDSWRPKGDWYIFAKREQVLPCYVIHFS